MSETLFEIVDPDQITRSAVISQDGIYRYRLDRDWQPANGRVCWIMLNPSTADAEQDDPTIRRCLRFTRDWGYGALTVVNLYAYRATEPRALVTARDPVGPDNPRHVADAIADARLTVAAWGASYPKAHGIHVERATAALRSGGAHVLGLTAHGVPRHPLFVPAAARPLLWSTLPTSLVNGHPALCLPCTETDIGMTLPDLRRRINEGLAKGRKRGWAVFSDTGARRWHKHQRPDTGTPQ